MNTQSSVSVPKVEREEFINMGIVLFSKQAKYLKSSIR